MKHKFIYLTTLLLALSFSISSCSDDDDKDETATRVSELKVSSSNGENNTVLFTYNANKALNMIENTIKNSDPSYKRIDTINFTGYVGRAITIDRKVSTYTVKTTILNNNQTQSQSTKAFRIDYKTNIVEIRNVAGSVASYVGTDTLSFDGNNNLTQVKRYTGEVYSFEYDTKGNLTKKIAPTFTEEYSGYDDKNSFLKETQTFDWFWVYNSLSTDYSLYAGFAGPNNPTQKVVNGTTSNYTYTFDNSNPTEISISDGTNIGVKYETYIK